MNPCTASREPAKKTGKKQKKNKNKNHIYPLVGNSRKEKQMDIPHWETTISLIKLEFEINLSCWKNWHLKWSKEHNVLTQYIHREGQTLRSQACSQTARCQTARTKITSGYISTVLPYIHRYLCLYTTCKSKVNKSLQLNTQDLCNCMSWDTESCITNSICWDWKLNYLSIKKQTKQNNHMTKTLRG